MSEASKVVGQKERDVDYHNTLANAHTAAAKVLSLGISKIHESELPGLHEALEAGQKLYKHQNTLFSAPLALVTQRKTAQQAQ